MKITITFDFYANGGSALNAREDLELPDSATWGQAHSALYSRLGPCGVQGTCITTLNGEPVLIGYSGLPAAAQILPLLEDGKRARFAYFERIAATKAEEAAQSELMDEWTRATGRTGSKHKQSRQAKRRKLAAHGTKSEYAAKMRAEITAA